MRIFITALFLLKMTVVAAEEGQLDDCLRAVKQGSKIEATLAIAFLSESEGLKCQEALDAFINEKEQRAEQARIEAQLRERDNDRLIERDVLAACTELFNEQKIVAMTNSVCVTAFRQFGHPDLDR